MKFLRSHSSSAAIFLLLIVLNACIDISDDSIHTEQSIEQQVNEVESVAEFVFENCLEMENSFPENHEEDDTGNTTQTVKKSVEWLGALNGHMLFKPFATGNLFLRKQTLGSYYSLTTAEVPSPPPWLA